MSHETADIVVPDNITTNNPDTVYCSSICITEETHIRLLGSVNIQITDAIPLTMKGTRKMRIGIPYW